MNVQMIKATAQRLAVLAAKLPEWLESMSPASRKAYLKAHPDSKYAGSLGGGSGGSGDKVADKHNATIRQSAADAKDSRAQIKLLKSQLPESTETRADKAKATRINKKIQEQMEHLKSHKATGDKAKTLLEKRNAAKTASKPEPAPIAKKEEPKAAPTASKPKPAQVAKERKAEVDSILTAGDREDIKSRDFSPVGGPPDIAVRRSLDKIDKLNDLAVKHMGDTSPAGDKFQRELREALNHFRQVHYRATRAVERDRRGGGR